MTLGQYRITSTAAGQVNAELFVKLTPRFWIPKVAANRSMVSERLHSNNLHMACLKQKTAVRQQQIVEASRKLIVSRGLENVTIGAIAQMVGLTEGAIYRHFTSKYQILELVIQDLEASLLSLVKQSQIPGAQAPDHLQRLMDTLLNSVEGQQAATLLVISQSVAFEGVGLGRRVAEMFTRFLQSIRAVLASGVTEKSVRADIDLDAAATTYFGMIQSTVTLRALNQFQPVLVGHRTHMWGQYYRGIMLSNPAVALTHIESL